MRQPNVQRTQKQCILEDRATTLTQSILPLNKPPKLPNQLSPSYHPVCTAAAAAARLLQLCPTLCDPKDASPPGSPVPGILQARTLERVAISFSSAWKWSRSVVSDSLRPHGLQPTRLLCPWDFPGKSTGVGTMASQKVCQPWSFSFHVNELCRQSCKRT